MVILDQNLDLVTYISLSAGALDCHGGGQDSQSATKYLEAGSTTLLILLADQACITIAVNRLPSSSAEDHQ